MRFLLAAAALSSLATFCPLYAGQQPKAKIVHKPAFLTCQSITQGDLNGNNAFLKADLPKGTKFISAGFEVRSPKTNSPWIDCQPGTTCNGAILPTLSSGSADQADGALNFAALVTPQGSGQFSAITAVRLVVTYQTEGPDCVSQTSFQVENGRAAAQLISIPKGKSIGRYPDMYRPSEPGTQFKLCDDWLSHPGGAVDACKPQVQFHVERQNNDAGDNAQDSRITCSNNSGKPVICRALIHY